MTNWLFLDIDGVLNAHSALITDSTAWPDYQLIDGKRKWAAVYSPEMVSHLNALIGAHDVTVIWATSWEDRAPLFGHSIGLRGAIDWPWLDTTDRDGNWGKHESLMRYIRLCSRPGDRIAWIDDDLTHEHEAALWAAQNDVLTIAPHANHGITPAHLEQLRRHYKEQ